MTIRDTSPPPLFTLPSSSLPSLLSSFRSARMAREREGRLHCNPYPLQPPLEEIAPIEGLATLQ